MRYVYGPVPSRRLGFSLGVDLVPYKVCTLDCIYCQLGGTTKKSVERKPYTRKDNVLGEVKKALDKKKRIDYITFSGSGEPTLNSDIGNLIREIKALTSIPVAVLTNGTMLFIEDVQRDLLEADIVLPSLDAVSQRMFRNINRPHDFLKIEVIVTGMKNFRKIYNGQIWLEIMLIKNFNDNSDELSRIKNAISEIQPDRVYLNTVVRPPSEIYAKPLSSAEMMSSKKFLDNRCEIIAEFHGQPVGEANNVEDAIIEMAKRRPLTIFDIANVLGISESNAEKFVAKLGAKNGIKERRYDDRTYYSSGR